MLLAALSTACTPTAPSVDASAATRANWAELLSKSANAEGFGAIQAPVQLAFPRDHGPHYAQRTEWWYVTGNLRAQLREFGFQLTFFRLAKRPGAPESRALANSQIMMAHFALTDVSGQQFYQAERFAFVDQQLASIEASPLALRLDDWQLTAQDPQLKQMTLSAHDAQVSINLQLRDLAGIVAQGEQGFSAKTLDGQQASAYYSMPRFATQGSIQIGGQRFEVSGLSWLDREWSTSQLAPEQIGWRWFALQFEDGSDLMLYLLLRSDGSVDPASAGTFRRADGSVRKYRQAEIQATPAQLWQAPDGSAFPLSWSLNLPEVGAIQVQAKLADQYFAQRFRYWEGAVRVSGARAGSGYLEQTGSLAR